MVNIAQEFTFDVVRQQSGFHMLRFEMCVESEMKVVARSESSLEEAIHRLER